MKKLLSAIFATLLGLLCLCGCQGAPDKIKFSDFPQYADKSADIVAVEVIWDNGTGVPVEFTVNDGARISRIVSALKQAEFIKTGTEPNDTGFSAITLVDGENNGFGVHLTQIRYGSENLYYAYADKTVYDTVKEIGLELGYAV